MLLYVNKKGRKIPYLVLLYINKIGFLISILVFQRMVTRTGFEPVNAAVKGRCVKPLHQLAIMAPQLGLEPRTP